MHMEFCIFSLPQAPHMCLLPASLTPSPVSQQSGREGQALQTFFCSCSKKTLLFWHREKTCIPQPFLKHTRCTQCDVCYLLALFSVLFQCPSNYYCILTLIRQEAALWVLTSCQYNQVWAMGMRSKCCFQNLVKNIWLPSHSKYIYIYKMLKRINVFVGRPGIEIGHECYPERRENMWKLMKYLYKLLYLCVFQYSDFVFFKFLIRCLLKLSSIMV